jgi:dual specificity phosphatase 12
MHMEIPQSRRTLATDCFVIMHERGQYGASKSETIPSCAHIFLHPLTWMRPSLYPGSVASADSSALSASESQPVDDAPLFGRLTCPSPTCGSNVGKFAWQGMQCSCGKWVVPAMGVVRSKIDVIEKTAKNGWNAHSRLGAMGIRLPPTMRLLVQPESSPESSSL